MPITGVASVFLSGRLWLLLSASGGIMELLREYQKEHPEECVELNRIKAHSQIINESRKRMATEKLKKIEECRRILYGSESTE